MKTTKRKIKNLGPKRVKPTDLNLKSFGKCKDIYKRPKQVHYFKPLEMATKDDCIKIANQYARVGSVRKRIRMIFIESSDQAVAYKQRDMYMLIYTEEDQLLQAVFKPAFTNQFDVLSSPYDKHKKSIFGYTLPDIVHTKTS